MTSLLRAPHIRRDSVLFVFGLGGIVYETLAQGGERPTLLILFGAMVGLPAFLRNDESAKLKKALTATLIGTATDAEGHVPPPPPNPPSNESGVSTP